MNRRAREAISRYEFTVTTLPYMKLTRARGDSRVSVQ